MQTVEYYSYIDGNSERRVRLRCKNATIEMNYRSFKDFEQAIVHLELSLKLEKVQQFTANF